MSENERSTPKQETPKKSEQENPAGIQASKAPISDELYNRIPDEFKNSDETADHTDKTDETTGESDESKRSGGEQPRFEPARPHFDRPHRSNGGKSGPFAPNPRSPFSPLFLILLVGLAIWLFYSTQSRPKSTVISWNGFQTQLEADNIESVNLRGNELTGLFRGVPGFAKLPENALQNEPVLRLETLLPNREFQDPANVGRWELRETIAEKKAPELFKASDDKGYALAVFDNKTKKLTGVVVYRRFTCEVPATAFADSKLDEKIRSKVQAYTSTTPPDNTGYFMLFSILLSVGILFVFWKMMRRTNEQMMGGGLQGFAKSPMRRYDPTGKQVTFKEVAGLENVKKELVEIVDFLKSPEKYHKMGARVPKGTMLFGPPGTGKTLLARAVAGEAGVPFFSINGSEFMQMFVGVGASRVRELFTTAKENAPSILFIDEIDAVGRQRGTGLGGGHDEREQTLNQILSEMDGFVPNETVMVMAATNRPDVLDPALMRPGRFDRHITVDRPSLKGRREIFDVYLAKIPKADDVDADKLARSTVGFTGADIENLVNEAALWATRNNKTTVDQDDFEFAHAKVIMGLVREETITEANKRKTAYHEAGHTIIDWFSPTNSKVHKVTIIPRGRALGATYILPEEDQLNVNETELRSKLAEYLAGRAAEQIIYSQTSTGAENDLKEATSLARRMVVHWGMSEKVGPVSFRAGEANPFLGREISEMREYSDATARLIDEEVVRILREAEDAANLVLNEKRDLLEKLTDALCEEEELDQDRLTEILGPAAERAKEGGIEKLK